MNRRLLVTLLQRCIVLLILVCLGCSAQSAPSDIDLKIEQQVRSYYSVPPDVKVTIGSRKPSEFPNYDSLTVTFESPKKKQDYQFLLSADQKTLIRMTKLDLTKDPNAELMAKIDLQGRPIRGNKDAKVVVVNYDDFECPYCSRMHQTLFPSLYSEYGDKVKFVYKDFPLEGHPWATHAAVDANCLAAQNSDAYWDFADYIHANQKDVNSTKDHAAAFAELDRLTLLQGQKHNLDEPKLQACLIAQNDAVIQASLKEGEVVGVDATPTMFINGEKMDGFRPAEDVRAVLDRALRNAGVTPPAHPAAPSATSPALSK
jgi:protein-disulfide isomerase